MDLQISVFLLFILFTAGHSLSCFECLAGPCALTTCPSENTNCLSTTDAGPTNTSPVTSKQCAPARACATWSYNTGSYKFSSYCCNTDLCNVQDASDPSNAPNGNKCYYCDEQKNCSKVLNCSGSQDRCFTSTGILANQTVAKGCVSKSFCDDTTSASVDNGNFTCCAGNLCNGAQSVTQSFLFLCCSLLSYFMMH
ncbi:hypothetical protein PO909_007708 [Leuciscus waleckii]